MTNTEARQEAAAAAKRQLIRDLLVYRKQINESRRAARLRGWAR